MNNSKQLSKEEIEKLLSCDNCKFAICEQCEISYTDKKKIRQYIEQLETNNQKLIDKLEKDIKNANNNINHMNEKNILQTIAKELSIGMRDYANEILEILKGKLDDK